MPLAGELDTIATSNPDGTRLSGDLRTVLRAVKDGTSARTLIVDLDGTDYAGGGLYELAQWCTADTLVIAIGSDASAERTREIMQAGVGDYLVKPVDPALLETTLQRLGAEPDAPPLRGTVTAFASVSGAGATTMAGAVALTAAPGRTLRRLCGPEPAVPGSGLPVEDRGPARPWNRCSPRPRTGRATRRRSLRFGDAPANAWTFWATGSRACSPPTPWTSGARMAAGPPRPRCPPGHRGRTWARPTCDSSCWIWSTSACWWAEPTLETADVLGRSLSLLNPGIPTWTVMNHTRPDSGSQAVESFETWGIRLEKDLTVPYDSRLGALIDRGWDEERGCRSRCGPPPAVLSRRLLGG